MRKIIDTTFTIDKTVIKEIDNKLTGVSKVLETGQTIFDFYAKYLQEKEVAFSILQPIAVASEIMMYVTFVLIADGRHLCEFIENQFDGVDFHNKKRVSYWTALIDNTALKEILKEYRLLRNMAAHTYHPISIMVAQSFMQRSYENIQRLELVINPLKI